MTFSGRPDAGNPHVLFEEGEAAASAAPPLLDCPLWLPQCAQPQSPEIKPHRSKAAPRPLHSLSVLCALCGFLNIVTREFCGRLAGKFTPTFLGFARKLRILTPLLKSVGINLVFSHKEDGNYVEFQIDKALFNPEPIASLPGGHQTVGETFSRKCKFYFNLAQQNLLRLAARLKLTAQCIASLGSAVEAAISTPDDYYGPPSSIMPDLKSA